jgi:acyl-CoA thioesterase
MNRPNVDAEARHAVERLYAADVAARQLGMQLVDAGPGRAVVSMIILPSMANGHGICHGGMIFTLADTAFAYACNAAGGTHLGASASIEFLAAARSGDVLRAEAVETWQAGRNGLTDVRVLDEAGKVVALFRGRSRRLPHDGGARPALSDPLPRN